MFSAVPPKHGLYDPQFEHDSCGVGFVVDIAGRKSNDIVRKALQVLVNLQHRGAKGCEANTGDGAGILIQIPHEFLKGECRKLGFNLPAPGNIDNKADTTAVVFELRIVQSVFWWHRGKHKNHSLLLRFEIL